MFRISLNRQSTSSRGTRGTNSQRVTIEQFVEHYGEWKANFDELPEDDELRDEIEE